MRTMAFSSAHDASASALHSSVLPTPVGPRKTNEPIGRLGVAQADTAAADGLGYRGNGFVLADDTGMQGVFQMEQALALVLGDAGCRDTGPAGDDFGNVLFSDFAMGLGLLRFPSLALVIDLGFLGVFLITQFGSLFVVLCLDGLFLVRLDGLSSSSRLCRSGGGVMLFMRTREQASSIRSMALSGS